jgi:hypothetical protein
VRPMGSATAAATIDGGWMLDAVLPQSAGSWRDLDGSSAERPEGHRGGGGRGNGGQIDPVSRAPYAKRYRLFAAAADDSGSVHAQAETKILMREGHVARPHR